MHRASRRIGVLALCFAAIPSSFDQEKATTERVVPPQPTLTVSLHRTALVANDTTEGTLWFTNGSEIPLSNVELRLSAPSFVAVGEYSGQKCTIAGGHSLTLGSVPPRTAVERRLCVGAGREIAESDFTVAFAIHYRWPDTGQTRNSGVVVVEKQFKFGLFGSESVGGVSLRLAALVLPGLLFLVLLQRVSSSIKALDTPTKAAATVVFSIVLVVVLSWFWPASFGGAMSAFRFLVLCAIAVALGLAAQVLVTAARADASARHKQRTVAAGEDALVALRKLLTYPSRETVSPATVALANGEEFAGGIAGRTDAGDVVLLGWYDVNGKDEATRAKLRAALAPGRYGRLFGLMDRLGIKPELRDGIEQTKPAGAGSTGSDRRIFPNADVREVVKKGKSDPLLAVV